MVVQRDRAKLVDRIYEEHEGGTFEFRGDQREEVEKFLLARGFRVKRIGG